MTTNMTIITLIFIPLHLLIAFGLWYSIYMLYSFRPLKLDKWFTPDEIKLLTSKTNEL